MVIFSNLTASCRYVFYFFCQRNSKFSDSFLKSLGTLPNFDVFEERLKAKRFGRKNWLERPQNKSVPWRACLLKMSLVNREIPRQ
jgi:hypothetical protein